ncbi:MAG: histidine kinase [Candidatus Didemnitutus sp.]|nr:histidine kinase [Candidatus Didemnitutus sp.]
MSALVHLQPITAATHPWRRRWLGTRRYWSAQMLGWGGFILLATQSFFTPEPFDSRAFIENLALAALGILITHTLRVLLLFFRRRPLTSREFIARIFPCWIAGSVAMGGAMSLLYVQLYRAELAAGKLVQGSGFTDYLDMVTRSHFFIGFWLSLYFGYLFYNQSRNNTEERLRLIGQIREAELRALKAQLNPHFLFNSLNTIRALVPRHLPQPRQAVTSLSELLRAALRLGDRPVVTLAEELGIVDHYLALETMRHEQRLRSTQQIDVATLGWLVPPFAVQSLVENAVNHGIAPRPEGGTVAITSRRVGDRLELTIANPGPLRTTTRSTGVGLQNLRAQLSHVYGPVAQLDLIEEAGQVVARLRLPSPRSAILPSP